MPTADDDDLPGLDFDVLASNVGVQVNLTRRALWLKASKRRLSRLARRPSGYYTALIMIGANPGVSQKQLADELFLDAGAVGDIVDLFEADGLVERRRDPADRRRLNLFLTEAGRPALNQARDASDEQDLTVTAPLTPAERVQLLALLKRLR